MSRAGPVAIATCDAWPDPGPGLMPLIAALRSRGVDVVCRPWQADDGCAFAEARLVLPLCAWDYARRPRAFREWILRIAAGGGRFANAPDLMLWNMDKSYLLDLADAGVPVPPGAILENPSAERVCGLMRGRGWRQAVLKPAIGQSGNGVVLLDLDRVEEWDPPAPGRHLLQPFLTPVREVGETTLTFLGGRFSHAVLRRPASGEWRANAQFGATSERIVPDPVTLDRARAALDALGTRPAYARIDGVALPEGFVVTEVELIEPALYLHLCPEGAAAMAEVICRQGA